MADGVTVLTADGAFPVRRWKRTVLPSTALTPANLLNGYRDPRSRRRATTRSSAALLAVAGGQRHAAPGLVMW